jgi:hypothetical protein
MTTYTLTPEVTLVTHQCGECGITYAMPENFWNERRASGAAFYCPNGHGRHFTETEATRLRRQLESVRIEVQRAYAQATHQRDQREAAERSNAALRGVVTRTKKRAAAGVCQCCGRTFQNVARHMEGQHPEFTAKALEAAK